MKRKMSAIYCLLLFLLAACARQQTQSQPDPVTVQLKWSHQAQFAGFYAAEQNGYYAEENLDVTLLPGGPQVDAFDNVQSGRAQFGIMGADIILTKRGQGIPSTAIAVIYRRNPLVFFSLKEANIQRPTDLKGKMVQISQGTVVIFDAILKKALVDPVTDQITIIPVVDMDAFFRGDVDVTSGYLTNEVLTARENGFDLNLIYPDDYGVHFYADTIYAMENYLAQNPELTERFLRATLKGWRWAVEHPQEAGNLVAKYNPDADPDHEIAQFQASVPLVLSEGEEIGMMDAQTWQAMLKILQEANALRSQVKADDAYTNQYLEAIYRDQP